NSPVSESRTRLPWLLSALSIPSWTGSTDQGYNSDQPLTLLQVNGWSRCPFPPSGAPLCPTPDFFVASGPPLAFPKVNQAQTIGLSRRPLQKLFPFFFDFDVPFRARNAIFITMLLGATRCG